VVGAFWLFTIWTDLLPWLLVGKRILFRMMPRRMLLLLDWFIFCRFLFFRKSHPPKQFQETPYKQSKAHPEKELQ
jgi:hypothetical protein